MELTASLINSPALTGLTPAEIQTLEGAAMLWDYRAGERIFEQGDPAFGLAIIEEGCVGVEIEAGGRIFPVADLGPGALVGWSGILAPHRFNCTTVCRSDTRLVVFKAEEVQRFVNGSEHLGYAFLNNVSRMALERLGQTQETLAEAISWYRYCRGYPL